MILDTLIAEGRYQLEFLPVEGNSRNAITIMHDGNTHTELVEKGLYLSKENEQLFFQHVASLLKNTQLIRFVFPDRLILMTQTFIYTY